MPSDRLADDIDHLSQIARARGLRIAVVESLTAGGLAHAVGAGESASDWFAGGIVAGTVYLGWAMERGRGHLHLQLEGDPDQVLADTDGGAVHLLLARAQDVHHDAAQSAHVK